MRRDTGKPGERVKAHNLAAMIGRLKDAGEMRPRHEAPTKAHAAFDDGAMHVENALEDFSFDQERAEVLPRHIERKVQELFQRAKWAGLKGLAQHLQGLLLLRRARIADGIETIVHAPCVLIL